MPWPFHSAKELLAHCRATGLSLSGLVMKNELALHSRDEIRDYFTDVWQTMQACIDHGLNTEGVLHGPLRRLLTSSSKNTNDPMNVIDWVNMFALAVNEENAAGGRVVTAPTNGACGASCPRCSPITITLSNPSRRTSLPAISSPLAPSAFSIR
ncbi:L-serine ammonia-lyase|nr:L-serine ammonia-lyase [Candidatus Pantoea persica]